MKKYSLICITIALCVIFSTCSDKTLQVSESTFKVVKTEISIDQNGGTGKIEVDTDGIEAESKDTWIKINASGKIINLTAEPNIRYESRTTNVVLKKGNEIQTIPITQLGTINEVNVYSSVFPTKGGKKSFLMKTIQTPIAVEMSEEAKKWLSWEMEGDSIVFTATPYDEFSQRVAEVRVSPKDGAVDKVTFKQTTSYEGTYEMIYTNIQKKQKKGFCIIKKIEDATFLLTLVPEAVSDFGMDKLNFKVKHMDDGALKLNETQIFYNKDGIIGRIMALAFFKKLNTFSDERYFTIIPQFSPNGLLFSFIPFGKIDEENMDAILLAKGTQTELYTGHFGSIMNIALKKISNGMDVPNIPEDPITGEGFNPLTLYAEYNIGIKAGEFAPDHSAAKQGYYLFSDTKDICPKGYRLPTEKDFYIAVGKEVNHVVFNGKSDSKDVSETVRVGANTFNFTADYFTNTKNNCYGIKFKGGKNQYRCAFHWEYKKSEKLFVVTSRLIGDDTSVNIEKVSSDDFWNKNNKNDVIRIFPAVGYKNAAGTIMGNETIAYYWSSEIHESGTKAMLMYFLAGNYALTGNISTKLQNNVRCIRE